MFDNAQESSVIASLNHPHICHLYDVGPNYLVMELVDGTPLRGPVPLKQAVEYAGQMLDALAAAHREGITHRDVKPANVLVTKQGVKLLDFGSQLSNRWFQFVMHGNHLIYTGVPEDLVDRRAGCEEHEFPPSLLHCLRNGHQNSNANRCEIRDLLHINQNAGLRSANDIHFEIDGVGAFNVHPAIENHACNSVLKFLSEDLHP